jgi:hypothetical protein
MKKTPLLSILTLALLSPVAQAGGVNLAWGTLCYTENRVSSTNFACDVNTSAGDRTMTVSFMLDWPMPDMIGVDWRIVGQSDAPDLPDWWKLGAAPECRAGMVTFNSDYAAVGDEICMDWTAAAGSGPTNYTWAGNQVSFEARTAIASSSPYAAAAGQEYYAGGVTILNGRTVGQDACAGCAVGMTFFLETVTATGDLGHEEYLQFPLPGGNQGLCWNDPQSYPFGWVCDQVVPARNTTWGRVKGLYR